MSRSRSYTWIPAALGALALTVTAAAWVSAQDDQAQSEKARCMSNMKQLSLGLMMYVQDYDEKFPPVIQWTPGVEPYVKNRDIYHCPSDPGQHSYAMNANLCCGSLAAVAEPAKITMLFESNLHKPNAAGTATVVAKPPRHEGMNNYSFTDGHVKAFAAPPAFGRPLLPPAVNDSGHKKKMVRGRKGR